MFKPLIFFGTFQKKGAFMKKVILKYWGGALITLALSLGFVSCTSDSDDDDPAYVYALLNVPFEKFFANETTGGDFDAYTSATQKAANGAMSYGTYYKEGETLADSVTQGIITPVKITKSALESLGGTEVTDESPSFDITITGRGASTIRYSGKQNLFKSADYSYYILSEEPAYYKEASVSGSTVTFGKIKGEATNIGTIYVTQKAGEQHHDFSPCIGLYTAQGTVEENATSITVKTLEAFEGGDTAQTVTTAEDGTETLEDKVLGELKAIIATDLDGNEYGLTTLSNFFWGKKQLGFKAPASEDTEKNYYPQHALVGKTVTKLTFVTEGGIYYSDSLISGTAVTDSTTKVVTFTPNTDTAFVIENIQAQ